MNVSLVQMVTPRKKRGAQKSIKIVKLSVGSRMGLVSLGEHSLELVALKNILGKFSTSIS